MASPSTASDPHCIFCKIVAGAIPCHRIFEDDQVLSFLDVSPLARGHALVVPKVHHVTVDQMPPVLAGRCMQTVATVAPAVMAALGESAPTEGENFRGWNVLQNNGEVAGQVVMHVHFHIIPRRQGDGLGYRWPAGKLDADAAADLLKRVRARL